MFSSVFDKVKTRLQKALVWMSQAWVTRCLASVIAWFLVHKLGQDIDDRTVASGLDLAFGSLMAIWQHDTFKPAQGDQ